MGSNFDPSISVHLTGTSARGIFVISAILSSSTSKAQRSMCSDGNVPKAGRNYKGHLNYKMQTSANRGPDSRFIVEVITNSLVPKSSRSSILKTQNPGYMNTNF